MNKAKPALVFLHGFRGDSAGLAEIRPFFAKFSVFIPSLPPAGNQALDSYSLEEYLDWLKNYLKDHQINQPILIGHSMGSIIASGFAERYPKLIHHKLILIAPISTKTPCWLRPFANLLLILPRKTVDYLVSKYLFVAKDRSLFLKTLNITHSCTKNFSSKKDLLKSSRFASSYSVADFEPKSQILMVAGSQDRLIPLNRTKKLAQKLSAKLKIIPRTGHLINYEAPEALARSILEFINS